MSEVSHFCLQIVLFNLISSYNSKLNKTDWQRRKVLFILCWSGKNQELSQFLLQGEKKENNFNRWFADVFHPTNNCGTLETQGIGAEIYWKNVRKVASTVPKM